MVRWRKWVLRDRERGWDTYWPRDEYPRKKAPDGVEQGRHNGGNLIVWCKAHSHHAIECELEHSEAHKEKVPENFVSRPLKSDHCINYYSIYASLNQPKRDFNDNLQGNKLSAYHAKKLKMKKLTVKYILPAQMHMEKLSTCPQLFHGKTLFFPQQQLVVLK
jgi:hypothetical protein